MNKILPLLCISFACLHAKVVSIAVPDQDWKIILETPAMAAVEENHDGQGPLYEASGGNSNLSIFVEEAHLKHGSSKDCYQFYWEKGRQNPLIKQDTVRVSFARFYYRVEYMVELPDARGAYRQKNVNYFFARNDRWVDVHFSVGNPTASDEALFTVLDKSLHLDTAAGQAALGSGPTQPAIKVLPLSNTDAVSITLSPRWEMQEVVAPSARFPFITFPFKPRNGSNASMLLTVYAKYQERGKIDDALMRKLIIGDSTPWIANAADKKMAEIHSLTFPHGHGLYASFVDANLVGKPPIKDDFKTSTCYILCLEDQYLAKVSVLCDDLSSREYQEAVAMIKSLAEAKR